ncbi:lysylphosphatidylglycerol synthase domain-containing protein [Sphingomonas sp. NFR15]|uniref:lysylphosphatidylglycerol synthase domain-containing protein n=1 Tax=Sphingomonas sp. NFR15 TaxID=1566282 RepID=UPI000885399A|nr:lysylphosphatidylglycerol synthase domain-containing protein [Sphingomonas sp. NFR15]SDA15200.1 putative membrane protein [Sphingomonas sp. NFR15]
MNRFARAGLLVATLIGIAVAGWTVGAVGARQVFTAMAAIGWLGMGAFLLCSAGVLLLLGGAWLVTAPGEPLRRLPVFVWARTTREAATDVLPFSQLGGLVVGARTLATRGVPDSLIYASMVADMTTEMAAQLLFTIAGVSTLLFVLTSGPVHAGLVPLAVGGLGVMAVLMLAFVVGQRPVLKLVGAVAARMIPGSVDAVGAVRARLDAIYREPKRILAAFVLNLLAWIGSAAGAWVALWFMGSHVPLWAALTIEALIFTLRSVAFAVPGAIGIQEAAYALIGPVFGLPPTTALALSLLKRARDLLIGVPAILAWQAGEVGALVAKRAEPA